MKALLYLFLIGAVIYGFNRYAPPDTAGKALAAVGLADFFQETLPAYARSKLSMSPEDPVKKRERILGGLSGALDGIEREIEEARKISSSAGVSASGSAASRSKTAPAKSSVSAELDKRLEKAKELVSRSEAALGELEKANTQQGFIARTAERLVDRILPAAETNTAMGSIENGVGGDSGGEAACPPR